MMITIAGIFTSKSEIGLQFLYELTVYVTSHIIPARAVVSVSYTRNKYVINLHSTF